MTTLSATLIFWLIAQGMAIGAVYGMIIKSEGVTVPANTVWGMIGSVATGSIAVFLQLGDELLFAFVGTLAFLFLVNAFHLHHDEDLFGHVDRGIRISGP